MQGQIHIKFDYLFLYATKFSSIFVMKKDHIFTFLRIYVSTNLVTSDLQMCVPLHTYLKRKYIKTLTFAIQASSKHALINLTRFTLLLCTIRIFYSPTLRTGLQAVSKYINCLLL